MAKIAVQWFAAPPRRGAAHEPGALGVDKCFSDFLLLAVYDSRRRRLGEAAPGGGARDGRVVIAYDFKYFSKNGSSVGSRRPRRRLRRHWDWLRRRATGGRRT